MNELSMISLLPPTTRKPPTPEELGAVYAITGKAVELYVAKEFPDDDPAEVASSLSAYTHAAGGFLLSALTGDLWTPAIGTMHLQIDPEGSFAVRDPNKPPPTQRIPGAKSFHAFMVRLVSDEAGQEDPEFDAVVDLTSGSYRETVARAAVGSWRRPDFPPAIYLDANTPEEEGRWSEPRWQPRLRVDNAMTARFVEDLDDDDSVASKTLMTILPLCLVVAERVLATAEKVGEVEPEILAPLKKLTARFVAE